MTPLNGRMLIEPIMPPSGLIVAPEIGEPPPPQYGRIMAVAADCSPDMVVGRAVVLQPYSLTEATIDGRRVWIADQGCVLCFFEEGA